MLVGDILDHAVDVLDLLVDRTDVGQEGLSQGGAGDAAMGPGKDLIAQLLLQLFDRGAQHGLGDKQVVGGMVDGTHFFHFQDIFELRQSHKQPLSYLVSHITYIIII